MAEPVKDIKPKPAVRYSPPAEPDEHWREIERWIFYIAIALLLYFVYLRIRAAFGGVAFFRVLAQYPWQTILFGIKIGAVGFSVWGVYSIVKLVQKLVVLRAELTASPMPPPTPEEALSAEKETVRDAWLRIEEKFASPNVSDWKLALLEADALMDEVLQKRGLEGTTMGERLKSLGVAERLRSYEALWDAHKLRNDIVHDAMREVSYEEARRAFGGFREAFIELGFPVDVPRGGQKPPR